MKAVSMTQGSRSPSRGGNDILATRRVPSRTQTMAVEGRGRALANAQPYIEQIIPWQVRLKRYVLLLGIDMANLYVTDCDSFGLLQLCPDAVEIGLYGSARFKVSVQSIESRNVTSGIAPSSRASVPLVPFAESSARLRFSVV